MLATLLIVFVDYVQQPTNKRDWDLRNGHVWLTGIDLIENNILREREVAPVLVEFKKIVDRD